MNKNYFTNPIEQKKRQDLHNLFDAWKAVIKKNNPTLAPLFTADGFFPGYFTTSPKVLFIGRESRFAPDGDRITSDLTWFSGLPSASEPYWRRILHLLYGIRTRGKYPYSDIPAEDIILKQMVQSNNYGFAIMNLSKYINEAEDSGTSNFNLINQFLEDSELNKRNFIREEIELLEPDIIITANLWGCKIDKTYLNLVFPPTDMSKPVFDSKDKVCLQNLRLKDRIIKRLDTYHFSAPGNDQEKFYAPAMEVLF